MTYNYLLSNFYTVVSSTTLYPEDIDTSKLMNMDMKLTQTNDKPQILIYHTHGQEGFTDSVSGDSSTTIVGVFDRHKAYDYAYEKIAQVLAEEYYAGFTRKNYIQAYQYNLHLRGKSMLIEAGAQTNTLQEELNAMELLAKLLDLELKGEQ